MRSTNGIFSCPQTISSSLNFVFLSLTEPEEEMTEPLQRFHGVPEQCEVLKNLFLHHLIWVKFGLGVRNWIQGHVHDRYVLYHWDSPPADNDFMTAYIFSSFLHSSLPPSLYLHLNPAFLPSIFVISWLVLCDFFLLPSFLFSSSFSSFCKTRSFYVSQAGLELGNPPVSIFQISGL